MGIFISWAFSEVLNNISGSPFSLYLLDAFTFWNWKLLKMKEKLDRDVLNDQLLN